MYIFDTDSITNILNKNPSKKLLEKLSGMEKKYQFITTVTIAEIFYAVFKSPRPGLSINELENILLPRVNILNFDASAAFYYGKIKAELEAEGKSISSMDLQVASIAIVHGLTLITGNTSHFFCIKDLKVENWID